MDLDANTVLGIALGWLVAQLVRWVGRRRFWAGVITRARRYLDDPAVPIDDPQSAVEAALVHEQSDRVRRVAESIAPQNQSKG